MTIQTLAAVARSPEEPFELVEMDLLPPLANEVRVKIKATGICHTDIAVKEQSFALPLPMVLGHEGAGVVEEVGGAITHVKVGDHVVLCGDSCGHCSNCHQGLPFYCKEFVERNLTGERVDGSSCLVCNGEPMRGRFVGQSSFSTNVIASAPGVIKVPKDLPLELLGPLGCGLTTGVGTVMNALKPNPGSSIAIFGAGTVGLSAAMGARLAGCEKIIVIDVNPSRLEMAMEIGATAIVNAQEEDVVENIQSITGGGANYSVECTGVPEVVIQAVNCLTPPGWCAQVGVTPSGITVPLEMDQVVFGRGIRGVVMGEANVQNFVPYLAELFRAGRLPYDRFVKFYDFADINQAVHDSAGTGEVIKPILRMP
ncbi:MAG: NAD(P)-dependent alcohol dehydrogenase [Gammaproteobacteria bacterium]|jgi:aryl-alcohol dehydrogenase|nr:NAD(P)-dependent alcohol dehydrogenase [Gammaproteobacteria bacterium]